MRQSVILGGGSITDFFTSPVSLILLILTIIVIIQVSYKGFKAMKER